MPKSEDTSDIEMQQFELALQEFELDVLSDILQSMYAAVNTTDDKEQVTRIQLRINKLEEIIEARREREEANALSTLKLEELIALRSQIQNNLPTDDGTKQLRKLGAIQQMIEFKLPSEEALKTDLERISGQISLLAAEKPGESAKWKTVNAALNDARQNMALTPDAFTRKKTQPVARTADYYQTLFSNMPSHMAEKLAQRANKQDPALHPNQTKANSKIGSDETKSILGSTGTGFSNKQFPPNPLPKELRGRPLPPPPAAPKSNEQKGMDLDSKSEPIKGNSLSESLPQHPFIYTTSTALAHAYPNNIHAPKHTKGTDSESESESESEDHSLINLNFPDPPPFLEEALKQFSMDGNIQHLVTSKHPDANKGQAQTIEGLTHMTLVRILQKYPDKPYSESQASNYFLTDLLQDLNHEFINRLSQLAAQNKQAPLSRIPIVKGALTLKTKSVLQATLDVISTTANISIDAKKTPLENLCTAIKTQSPSSPTLSLLTDKNLADLRGELQELRKKSQWKEELSLIGDHLADEQYQRELNRSSMRKALLNVTLDAWENENGRKAALDLLNAYDANISHNNIPTAPRDQKSRLIAILVENALIQVIENIPENEQSVRDGRPKRNIALKALMGFRESPDFAFEEIKSKVEKALGSCSRSEIDTAKDHALAHTQHLINKRNLPVAELIPYQPPFLSTPFRPSFNKPSSSKKPSSAMSSTSQPVEEHEWSGQRLIGEISSIELDKTYQYPIQITVTTLEGVTHVFDVSKLCLVVKKDKKSTPLTPQVGQKFTIQLPKLLHQCTPEQLANFCDVTTADHYSFGMGYRKTLSGTVVKEMNDQNRGKTIWVEPADSGQSKKPKLVKLTQQEHDLATVEVGQSIQNLKINLPTTNKAKTTTPNTSRFGKK